jgi:hypothetical protein
MVWYIDISSLRGPGARSPLRSFWLVSVLNRHVGRSHLGTGGRLSLRGDYAAGDLVSDPQFADGTADGRRRGQADYQVQRDRRLLSEAPRPTSPHAGSVARNSRRT